VRLRALAAPVDHRPAAQFATLTHRISGRRKLAVMERKPIKTSSPRPAAFWPALHVHSAPRSGPLSADHQRWIPNLWRHAQFVAGHGTQTCSYVSPLGLSVSWCRDSISPLMLLYLGLRCAFAGSKLTMRLGAALPPSRPNQPPALAAPVRTCSRIHLSVKGRWLGGSRLSSLVSQERRCLSLRPLGFDTLAVRVLPVVRHDERWGAMPWPPDLIMVLGLVALHGPCAEPGKPQPAHAQTAPGSNSTIPAQSPGMPASPRLSR